MNTLEIEKTILASLLTAPHFAKQVFGIVKTDDFYDQMHRLVFGSMEKLYKDDIEINLLTTLAESDRVGLKLTREDFEGILEFIVPIESADSFVRLLKKESAKRTLLSRMSTLSEDLKSGKSDVDDAISKMGQTLQKVTVVSSNTTTKYGDELFEDFINYFDVGRSDLSLTGVPDVDKSIVDFEPTELIVFAARPSVGKTTLLIQSALTNLMRGKKVAFYSLEMPAVKILMRMISNLLQKDMSELQKIKSSDEFRQKDLFMSALATITSSNFYIEDAVSKDINSIVSSIRKMKLEHDIDVVYIDYLQLITVGGGEGNRQQEISRISAALKGLGVELKIPVVTASQLSRAVEGRTSNRPFLSDLRESGSIEQDASIVLFIYIDLLSMGNEFTAMSPQDLEGKLKQMRELPVNIEIAKQRNGTVYSERINMKKYCGRFESFDARREDYFQYTNEDTGEIFK